MEEQRVFSEQTSNQDTLNMQSVTQQLKRKLTYGGYQSDDEDDSSNSS